MWDAEQLAKLGLGPFHQLWKQLKANACARAHSVLV